MLSPLRRALITGALVLILAACSTAPAAAPAATPIPTPAAPPTAAPAATPTPAPTPIPTAEPEPAATSPKDAPSAAQDLAPKRRSVWDTKISPGETLGNCAGGAILPVYGLVQITPTEEGLEWKNQEPVPYAMARLAPNTYRFAGPSSINDGVVTMTVTFVDEKSLVMLREFTPNAEPGCIHRHEYTGEFKWFR
ncbi:MAG: hypothetical protein K6U78_01790 [Anaerolineae bacterium]|jgi:glucose/arabinose dehydrogenase|nr:hypothetical protein [Anaerolineae bacterium]